MTPSANNHSPPPNKTKQNKQKPKNHTPKQIEKPNETTYSRNPDICYKTISMSIAEAFPK